MGAPFKLQCRIRRTPVAATPEERVRQSLLRKMTDELGYPLSLIVVEKELRLLPHLLHAPAKPPDRRVDILCYGKGIHPVHELYPLLVVECKAVKIDKKVLSQVAGYNYHLKSFYISAANQHEVRTGWVDPASREYRFVPFLPSYQELLQPFDAGNH